VFFGAYAAWTTGPFYVDAAAGYGHAQFSTTRTITVGATSEIAQGEFDGHQYGGRIEAGWRFDVARYRLTPFAGVVVQALRQNPYSENARNVATNLPGRLGLSYQGETTTSVRSVVGAQATTTFALGERIGLTPRIQLAWAHEFTATRQVNASFLALPAAAFTVNGARPARDAAIVTAGADLALGRNVALYAQFDSELSGGGNAYAGSGGLRLTW
jgi:outer membrane autotransporter protein